MKRYVNIFLCVIVTFALVGCSSASKWQTQYELGIRYLNDGNYTEAIIAFTAAIEIDEKNVEAYLGRADAYIASGETEENLTLAFADYEKIISFDSANTEAYLGMADVYIRRGEFDKAIEILVGIPNELKTDEIAAMIAEMKKGNISDSAGKTRKSCHYENGVLQAYWIYEYDERGNNILTIRYNGNDEITDTLISEFDENGLELRQITKNAKGDIVTTEAYEYDSKGRRIKETRGNSYSLITYDDVARTVTEDAYNSEGINHQRFVVENDENGRRFKGSSYQRNENGEFYLTYYVEYIWNNDGSYGGYNLFEVASQEG